MRDQDCENWFLQAPSEGREHKTTGRKQKKKSSRYFKRYVLRMYIKEMIIICRLTIQNMVVIVIGLFVSYYNWNIMENHGIRSIPNNDWF